MKIACIGWGSLIWDTSREFIIDGDWQTNGPILPIEFARQSNSGNITLVIEEKAKLVQTLWAKMTDDNIPSAMARLRIREGTGSDFIHYQRNNSLAKTPIQQIILQWMAPHELDAVIWTGLPSKFNGKNGLAPTLEELKAYFKNLQSTNSKTFEKAKEYILNAPKQVETNYRPHLEELFTEQEPSDNELEKK